MKYQFDLADFLVYQMLCHSVLRSNPFCHDALCMDGIFACLAQETIPNTATLLGPSQDALDGLQKIFVCRDDVIPYRRTLFPFLYTLSLRAPMFPYAHSLYFSLSLLLYDTDHPDRPNRLTNRSTDLISIVLCFLL